MINAWFELVKKTKAHYGIVDQDVYNFDETGFMMRIISTAMVVTTSEGRGKGPKWHSLATENGRQLFGPLIPKGG